MDGLGLPCGRSRGTASWRSSCPCRRSPAPPPPSPAPAASGSQLSRVSQAQKESSFGQSSSASSPGGVIFNLLLGLNENDGGETWSPLASGEAPAAGIYFFITREFSLCCLLLSH
jgi:hypothetical protein